MTILTSTAMRSFVSAARLPKAPPQLRGEQPSVTLKNTDAQALVVGSGLIVAAENVPAQTRQDIVSCTLFAQLAASGTVSDPSDVAAWYGEYFKVLGALGWAQNSTQFEELQAGGKHLEAHRSIIKVLSVMLGPTAPAVLLVTETLNALGSMSENSPWITLFNRESTTTRSARFQVATAQVADDGLVEIALVAFDLRSKSTLTQVLFFKFNANTIKLKFSQGRATIYEAALAQTRQDVSERLAAYRAAYVAEVKFPPKPASVATSGVRGRRRSARSSRGVNA
jgi:hypothetical protein